MSGVIDIGQESSEMGNGVKSLDKLEIQLEEQNLAEEASHEKVENDRLPELSPKVSSPVPEVCSIKSSGSKSKLSLKFPQILRRRPEVVVQISSEEVHESDKVVNGHGHHGDNDKEKANQAQKTDTVVMVDTNCSNSDSFLSSFTSPQRWTNFRRIFSFYRSSSTPTDQEMRVNGVAVGSEEIVVTLDITQDGQGMSPELVETKDESTVGTNGNGGIPQEKSLTLPLLSLLTKKARTKPYQELRDVEGLAKSNSTVEQQVQSEEKMNEILRAETTPEKSNGDKKDLDKNSPLSNGKTPKSQIPWGSRLLRLSDKNKLILGSIFGFILLLVAMTAVLFCRNNQAIDIGSLIIDGKFINTMTSCGPIQGTLEDGGYAFRGIPYALPPVGELRWRPAQPHSHLSHCWNGTYQATKEALRCWQFYRNGNYDGSEDCLYVDVYTPKPYYDSPLPVVVYIDGESLNGGESTTVKPSTKLAVSKSVVFVNVAVRRSVLGFLAVEPISQNSYPMTSGNYGLSDLLAALHWVKLNAQHFGGDPHHVTLLGHQGGASLVLAMLTTRLGKGLFHQAWISGGSPPTSLLSVPDAEVQNAQYLTDVGCSSIECLHNKGPEELLESVPNDWRMFQQDLPNRSEKRHHWLIQDGLILRAQLESETIPRNQLEPEDLSKIPFVAGASAEIDASLEMYSYLNWNDTSKFSTYLESSLGSFGPSLPREVIDRYFRPESTSWQTFVSILSDVRTICPLYYATLARADPYDKLPVYFYVATQRKNSPIGFIAEAQTDIGAILGTYVAETRDEKKFVANMQKLFYDFVEKGNLPEIQDVTKSIVKVDESIQKIYTYPNCDFWQEHNFYPNYSRID